MDFMKIKSYRYSHAFDRVLIDLVRKYPLLYDKHHIYYRHSKQKNSIWNDIANKLKATNNVCRSRWKSLVDKWTRQKLFNESSKSMPNRKHFDLFDEMAFLNKDCEKNDDSTEELELLVPTLCSTILGRSVDQDALNGYCDFVSGNSPVRKTDIQPKIEEVDLTMENEGFDDQQPDSETGIDLTSIYGRKQTHLQNQSLIRKEQNSIINSPSGEMKYECDIAGRRIGYQLRSVDEFQRAIAEKLISDIIFNAKMGNLTENSTITLDQQSNSSTRIRFPKVL